MNRSMKFDYHSVPGDYQYRALREGYPLQRFWHHQKMRLVAGLYEGEKTGALLEIGCGSGNLLFHAGRGFETVCGTDISEQAVRFCRQRARQEGRSEAVFPMGSAYTLPFRADLFKLVLICDVLEHLERPQVCLAEAWRVLQPGGTLILTTPNTLSFWPALEWLIDAFHLTPAMKGEQHITHFTAKRLEVELARAGFHPQRTGTVFALSILAQFLSPGLAGKMFAWEQRGKSFLPGALLYSVAAK
jgi:ubiquinone/menaquinone biosynthesis C-methylase UbiE